MISSWKAATISPLTYNYIVPATLCANIQANQTDNRTGIIQYSGYPKATPVSLAYDISTNCTDEPYESLVPIVKWAVGSHPANNVPVDTYEAGLSATPSESFPQPHGNVSRWDLTDTPLW